MRVHIGHIFKIGEPHLLRQEGFFIVPGLVFNAEESVENFSEGDDVVQIVENYDARQIGNDRLALLSDVRQILSQFFARLMIDVEY